MVTKKETMRVHTWVKKKTLVKNGSKKSSTQHDGLYGKLFQHIRVLTTTRTWTVDDCLRKYCQVDGDLEGSTDGKLQRRAAREKVESLERVSDEPHEHHGSTNVIWGEKNNNKSFSSRTMRANEIIIPHSKGGFGDVIIVELRQSQHGFDKKRCETENFDVYDRIQERVGQHWSRQCEQCDELDVGAKIGPLPKVTTVKICCRINS